MLRSTIARSVIIGGTTGLGLSAARACIAAERDAVVCGRNPDSAATSEQDPGSSAAVAGGQCRRSVGTATAAIRLGESMFSGGFDARLSRRGRERPPGGRRATSRGD